ncbi:MAG: SCO family protein [Bacteroidetes bacterium]|nr:SCO family protein [Bacteroidota bacterium]
MKYLYISFLFVFLVACSNQTSTAIEAQNRDNTKNISEQDSNSLSVYQIEGDWLTQNNKKTTLPDLKGKIQVVAMIFTSCQYACPKITDDILAIEKNIMPSDTDKVGFTLISFDVERDSVSKLKKFAFDKKLGSRWTLLRGTEEQVRTLSMLLDVNYEKQPDGSFNHTNIITILDKKGVILYRYEGLEIDAKAIAKKIKSALQ